MTLVNSAPPKSCFILVIGGGPSGSYAASCLAREGLSVVLLEADKFPRYHVGESMLPSMRHFLRYIDLEETFDNFGFTPKMGAAFKFNAEKREGYTDFVSQNKGNFSWNVVRADADALMLEHAKSSGVQVFEETHVTSVDFEPRRGISCPVSASWKNAKGVFGNIDFEWLIDASGRNGVMARHLGTRKFNKSLKNIACWGYWKNARHYDNGIAPIGPPYFEALNDESGWAWFIPLHNGTTSVGVVMDETVSKGKKSKMDKSQPGSLLTKHYMEELQEHAPNISALLQDATLVGESTGGLIKSASDYSYSATSYSGPNYRLVGDAAAFIDPFFSSGVHLGLSSAISAAATICATLRGDCSVADASEWHNSRVGTSYTRFLMVVLSAYRQMRAQKLPILSDVDENNFDRAFQHFRVVIQGDADVKKALSEVELRNTIDFCTQAFEPETLEHFHKEGAGGAEESVDAAAVEKRAADVLLAKKSLGAEEMFHIGGFISDKLNGMNIRLLRGRLGLEK